MTRLVVEVEDFVDAARILHDRVAEPVRVSSGRLGESLADSSKMAGDDPGGLSWAKSYDAAARSAALAMGQVVDAAYTTSSMFGRSGMNYAEAEAASTASGSQSSAVSALLAALPPTTFTGPTPVPPPASGGDTDHPPGWWLVEHTVGYMWPNGHQDRLHAAAAAWRASAAALDEVAFEPVLAGIGFARDRLPEADDILTVCRGLNEHLQDLAAAHRSLAHACTGLAQHIDECHSAVEHELAELMAWSAGIQVVGAIVSIVSFGAAEAPSQAAQVAKIAQVAAKIGTLIRAFTLAAETVAAVIDPIAFAIERIRLALESLATTRLAAAGVTVVPGIVRASRVAKDGVRLSKTARAEVAATERLATASVSMVKMPSLLHGRRPGGPGVWSSPKSLARHFRDHGPEVGAKTADEYASKASDLLQRGTSEGLPRRIDPKDGTIRVFDPSTGEFGAFRPDGSAITYFKPTSPTYFDRQPGALR